MTYVSNVTGQCYKDLLIKIRNKYKKSFILVDGSQSCNLDVNISNLNCDFFYFSSHK